MDEDELDNMLEMQEDPEELDFDKDDEKTRLRTESINPMSRAGKNDRVDSMASNPYASKDERVESMASNPYV